MPCANQQSKFTSCVKRVLLSVERHYVGIAINCSFINEFNNVSNEGIMAYLSLGICSLYSRLSLSSINMNHIDPTIHSINSTGPCHEGSAITLARGRMYYTVECRINDNDRLLSHVAYH